MSPDPTLAGDVLEPERFPFASWAGQNGFAYPPWAAPLFKRCGSAAEAYFLRAFVEREDAELLDSSFVMAGDEFVILQQPCRLYRIDAVVMRRRVDLALAIEIDGFAYHHATLDQVERDYLRERRLVCEGYTVMRFTAREVFHDARECWRQIDATLDAWHTRAVRTREARGQEIELLWPKLQPAPRPGPTAPTSPTSELSEVR